MTELNTKAIVGSLDKLIAERDAWKEAAEELRWNSEVPSADGEALFTKAAAMTYGSGCTSPDNASQIEGTDDT
jgi:hypothetical protein